MSRIGLLRHAFAATRYAPRRVTSINHSLKQSSLIPQSRTSPLAFQAVKWYSSHTALTEQEVQGRIVDLLKNFDKVTEPEKLSPNSHFYNDLGLDSLDTVEVVMAIEEEFSLEIPDKDADAINSVDQAVKYILAQPDGIHGSHSNPHITDSNTAH
ncbi:hypothetical protein Golomagni_00604 [Golovinomyces magnicellulatus]|nr:hypothetical protein Golomagni_00604 [Golovinomyces magnicellulatus]